MTWSVAQLEDRAECVDKFDVGVRNMAGQEERKLCSLPAKPGLKEFQCKLDLSNMKFCDNKFGFWVTAVNINHNRGVERVQSFANTILEVKCGGQSQAETEKVSSLVLRCLLTGMSSCRCCPPPAWPSVQTGPPDPSYGRLGRPLYSESVKPQPNIVFPPPGFPGTSVSCRTVGASVSFC